MRNTFFIAIFFVLSPLFARADATTTDAIRANVNIRYGSDLVWSGQVVLDRNGTTTAVDNVGASHSIASDSALSALVAADIISQDFSLSDLAYYASYDPYLVNCMDVGASSTHACYNWQYVVNSTYPSVGAASYRLSDGDTLYFYFGTPRRFSLSATSTYASIPISVHAESYDYTDDSWHPLTNSLVGATQPNPSDPYSPIVPFSGMTDANGIAQLRVNTAGMYDVGLASDFYYPTVALSALATTTQDVVLRLRDGANIVYEGVFPLPAAGTSTIQDSDGASHDISSRSALNILALGDVATSSFDVSNLTYYPSYGSFYIKCIRTLSSDECDNWQYAVNGDTPGASADSYDVSGGNEVYFYFASPQRIAVSTSSMVLGESVIATAEAYHAGTNVYSPLRDIILGLSRDSVILGTSTTDTAGQATFALTATGTYDVGIYNDGAYGAYLYPTVTFTITGSQNSNTGGSGGGSGGGSSSGPDNSVANIDTAKALAFLVSKQRPNGSFGAPLYTDWASIALGSVSEASAAKAVLRDYLTHNHVSGSIATDYERRAMALMALDISPYDGTGVDYIHRIVNFFDGTQIGDSGLVNDDIFAIFPLMNAGYSTSDEIIGKTVEFILSRQSSNGSWESIDLTSAAIQALRMVDSLPHVPSAIAKAKEYLKSAQGSDGGFGNVSSTSWVMQAMTVLGEANASWAKNGKTPGGYLSSTQSSDGGFGAGSSDDSRAWQTAYALVAGYGRTWSSILANFRRLSGTTATSGGSSSVPMPAIESVPVSTSPETLVYLNIAIDDFVKRYMEAIKIKPVASLAPRVAIGTKSIGPQGFDLSLVAKKSQAASVMGAVLAGSSTPAIRHWFTPLFKFFGL